MKIRITFSKNNSAVFMGHLDVMRYFQKSIKRAGIDVTYSAGFSPHQIMSFASPLGVGVLSCGEVFDLEINKMNPFTSFEEMKDALNSVMVDGFYVNSVRELPENAGNAMASLMNADYVIAPLFEHDFTKDINSFINQTEIKVLKKTKRSENVTDIKPLINELKLTDDGIYMNLKTGSRENLKPNLVMDELMSFAGIQKDDNRIMYKITRLNMFDEEMKNL